MNEGIQFSGVLRGQVRFNIQVLDATADPCVVSGGIKTVDSGNAAATGTNAVPGRIHIVTQWREHSHACDYNTSFSHTPSPEFLADHGLEFLPIKKPSDV